MQRATTARATATAEPRIDGATDCPVCGEPIRGIAAARPGEHRFVGCDHYASARFLRTAGAAVGADPTRLRLGP